MVLFPGSRKGHASEQTNVELRTKSAMKLIVDKYYEREAMISWTSANPSYNKKI